jgi:glycosyltransferase involved in cell wall biosynthesis
MINNASNSDAPRDAPPPLAIRSEAEVMQTWQTSSKPLVSILCATYNHAEFIEDAIKGFLGQVTSFPFEIVIRDDASTDGTDKILMRYAKDYPRLINLVLKLHNKYPNERPLPDLLSSSVGEYIAICEGDDYWIDSNKLELQLQAIQDNPRVTLVSSPCIKIEKNMIIGTNPGGGTRTYLFRRFSGYPRNRQQYIYFGDTYTRSLLLSKGEEHRIKHPTAVWRRHSGGVWSSLLGTDETLLNFRRAATQFWLVEHFLENSDNYRARKHLAASVDKTLEAYPSLRRSVFLRMAIRELLPEKMLVMCRKGKNVLRAVTSRARQVGEG